MGKKRQMVFDFAGARLWKDSVDVLAVKSIDDFYKMNGPQQLMLSKVADKYDTIIVCSEAWLAAHEGVKKSANFIKDLEDTCGLVGYRLEVLRHSRDGLRWRK